MQQVIKNFNFQFKFFFENKYLIIFLFTTHIFLWSFKIGNFQFKYLIFILAIPAFFKILDDIKKKNYFSIKAFFTFSIFIISHYFLNIIYDKVSIDFISIYSFFALSCIFFISYYYGEIFLVNKKIIFILIFTFFFLSTTISIFLYKNDSPYFCGFVLDYFKYFDFYYDFNGKFAAVDPFKKLNLSYKEFFFNENSHLAMVFTSVFFSLLYLILQKKISIFFLISSIVFIITCYIKSSTTFFLSSFLIGTFFSIIFIILKKTYRIKFRTIFIFFFIGVFSLLILISFEECRNRFGFINNIFNKNQTNHNINLDRKFFKSLPSISSKIGNNFISMIPQLIKDKPFGWGWNRMEYAFLKYNKNSLLAKYNNKDGASNAIKLLFEFGILSLIFYMFVFYYCFQKKVPIENKIFLVSFIITQSIRGAGYFNGGFILICFLIFFDYLKYNLYLKNQIKIISK